MFYLSQLVNSFFIILLGEKTFSSIGFHVQIQKISSGFLLKLINVFHRGSYGPPIPELVRKPMACCDFPRWGLHPLVVHSWVCYNKIWMINCTNQEDSGQNFKRYLKCRVSVPKDYFNLANNEELQYIWIFTVY